MRKRAVLALALALVAARAYGSNGASPITSSPKAAGRGGAELAVGDDAYTVATNPAGMGNFPGTRIDLSAAFYTMQVSFTDERNHGRDARGFPGPTPSLGFVQGIGTADADGNAPGAIGVALVPVAGGQSHALFKTALFPEGERETSKLAVIGLDLGFSLRVHPRISIGAALTGLYASLDQEGLAGGGNGSTQGLVRNFQNGQVDAADPFFLVNGQPTTWGNVLSVAHAPNTFSSSRVTVENARAFGVGGVLGALVNVLDELSIGAAYRAPGWLTPLEGRAFLDSSTATSAGSANLDSIQGQFLAHHLPGGGGNLSSRYDARLSGLRMPQSAGIGVAFWPHPRVLLALDVKWIDWGSAFNTINVQFRNGRNPDLAEITSNGASRSVSSKVLYRWHEQYVLAVGGAVAVTDFLRLRLGYNYGTNPVPTRTENPFNAATVEHHACVGFGLAIDRFSLDAAWVHAFPKSTSIHDNAQKPDYNGVRHKTDQDTVLLGGAVEF